MLKKEKKKSNYVKNTNTTVSKMFGTYKKIKTEIKEYQACG